MKYRSGEMAEFFGLTKTGIRYLEKEGVIHAERDAGNRYRWFGREEITRLKDVRAYQQMGCSLPEAARLTQGVPREELLANLREKDVELQRQILALQQTRRLLENRIALTDRLFTDDCFQIMKRPAAWFFPAVPEEDSAGTPEERRRLARARHVEKEWIRAMPAVSLCARQDDRMGQPLPRQGNIGSYIPARERGTLGLPLTESMIFLPACLCARGVISAPDNQKPEMNGLPDWIREQGYSMDGDVYACMHLHYLDEQGACRALHEFFVPIVKKNA